MKKSELSKLILVISLISLIIIFVKSYNPQKIAIYRIEIPELNALGGTHTYHTKSYTNENGCVVFTDEDNYKRKICGNYQIIGPIER